MPTREGSTPLHSTREMPDTDKLSEVTKSRIKVVLQPRMPSKVRYLAVTQKLNFKKKSMAKFFIQKVHNRKAEMNVKPTTLGECMKWIAANTTEHPDNDDIRVDPKNKEVIYHIIRIND